MTPYTWNSGRAAACSRALQQRVDAATPDQIRRGMTWYGTARDNVRQLSMSTPYSAVQVAAVVAVTSPATAWSDNVTDATAAVTLHAAGLSVEDALKTYNFRTYHDNVRKAWRVLDGDLDAVRGDKVSAFFANLCGNEDVVTIDRHAWTAAGLEYNGSLPAQYRRGVVKLYERIARDLEVTPAQAQAIVWIVERETFKGHAPDHLGGSNA